MTSAPPGWYPDPSEPSRVLYWDGAQWVLPADEAVAMGSADVTPFQIAPEPQPYVPAADPYRPATGTSNGIGRVVAIGALVIALLGAGVAVGVVLTGGDGKPAASAPDTTTGSGTPTTPSTPTTSGGGALVSVVPRDPNSVGYGVVRLRMNLADLRRTRAISGPGQDNGPCTTYPISYGGTAYYSHALAEVVGIEFGGPMGTSRGISLQSTGRQFARAYPDVDLSGMGQRGMFVPIKATAHYIVDLISLDQKVTGIRLLDNDQDCGG